MSSYSAVASETDSQDAYSAAASETDSQDASMSEESVEVEEEEVRVDLADGGTFTRQEFKERYGGLREWLRAPGYHQNAQDDEDHTDTINAAGRSQRRSVNRSRVWVCASTGGCNYMKFGDICELDDSMPRRGKFGLFRCARPDSSGSDWFPVEKMSVARLRHRKFRGIGVTKFFGIRDQQFPRPPEEWQLSPSEL